MAEHKQSDVEAGYVMTVAEEFRALLMEQTEGGCSIPVIAAGLAYCLEEGAKLDPGWKNLRIILAGMLKEHADED